jgi:glycosyltransferase involved in cell wall biosynthesis
MTPLLPTPPRLTLAVLSYRQSACIEDAVLSALGQTGESIEVLLSDDCSPDDTYERMQALVDAYRGQHQVVLRRNQHNLGIGAHVDTVMKLARGELLVLMGGDDISLPGRAAATLHAYDASGQKADLLACHVTDMSVDGTDLGVIQVDDLSLWTGIVDWARRRPYVIGAGHAVTRRLMERFGPLQAGVVEEDQVNTLRAICSGGAVTIPQALVRYRRGGISSGARELTVQDFLQQSRRRNSAHLALLQQWLVDARSAGCAEVVEAGIRTTFERETFMAELLSSTDWAGRLQAVRRATRVAPGWRLKKLLHIQWPGIAVGMHRLQQRWRQMALKGQR